MSVRVVLDTSTLVSAALRVGSIPHRAMLEAFGACEVCVSVETLAELDAVLGRAKFDAYLDRETRLDFVSRMSRVAQMIVVQEHELRAVERTCRDPADDKFLALALASEAHLLVSSDDDLLVLHPWRGIDIVTPKEFLTRYGLQEESKSKTDI